MQVRGKDNRLAAKERAAAQERSTNHRRVKAEMAAAREGGGTDRARHLASKRTTPPISRAMTVSLQRFDLHSSGYVRSLARLAMSKAAPAGRPPALRGRPAAVTGETSVVSTASRELRQSGTGGENARSMRPSLPRQRRFHEGRPYGKSCQRLGTGAAKHE